MASVFLSHSSRDKNLANRLANDLKAVGVRVWLDEWEILVGDSITQRIQHGLEEVDFVAVILTRHGVASGWVEKEWQSRIGEEATNRKVVVLPLKADDSEIPALLRDKKYADFHQDYGNALTELLAALKGHNARVSGSKSASYLSGTSGLETEQEVYKQSQNPVEDKYARQTKFAMNKIRKLLAEYIPDFEKKFNPDLQAKVIKEATSENVFKIKTARALVFGHTGVGKTTTINKLLNSNIFPTSGQLSCTKSLTAGQHTDGLIFYDSPGTGDKPEQENITRVALGVPQREYQEVRNIKLLDITMKGQEGPVRYRKLNIEEFKDDIRDQSYFKANKKNILGKEFKLADFKSSVSKHPFDFVVFVMSSEKGLPYDDCKLIQDFYHSKKSKKIKLFKVYNIFHDKFKSDIGALDQKFRALLSQAKNNLRDANVSDYEDWILIDSQRGHGLETFVRSFADSLPVDVLKGLSDVLKKEYTQLILDKLDQYFYDYLARIASLVAVFPVDYRADRRSFLKFTVESLAIVGEFIYPLKDSMDTLPSVKMIVEKIKSGSTRTKYKTKYVQKKFLWIFNYLDEIRMPVEYAGVGGINSIRLLLELGILIRDLFAGIESNKKEKIELKINSAAKKINKITSAAGKKEKKTDKLDLAERLYPLIRGLL